MVYGNMIIPLKMFCLYINSFISVSAVRDIDGNKSGKRQLGLEV